MTSRPERDAAKPSEAPSERYVGAQWVTGRLPRNRRPWFAGGAGRVEAEVARVLEGKAWLTLARPAFVVVDPRGDVDALFTSLVASGAVAKTGQGDEDFRLTESGERGRFLLVGDFLGLTTTNLRVLRVVKGLIDRGADVELIAGNRDVALLLALVHVGRKDPRLAHLFARMGARAVRMLVEVFDQFLVEDWGVRREFLAAREQPRIREMLLPDETWYLEFPDESASFLTQPQIDRELGRLRERLGELEQTIDECGLNLAQLHAAIEYARDLFLEPEGEFAWFFERLQVVARHGSCLVVHAGFDDEMAALLAAGGVDAVNARFTEMLDRNLFELYYGPVGNLFRTRYRTDDYPMTDAGWGSLRRAGALAVLHGHGIGVDQVRLGARGGLLDIACDMGMDRVTRSRQSVRARGGGAVVLGPDGRIEAVCAGQTHATVFDPAQYAGLMTVA